MSLERLRVMVIGAGGFVGHRLGRELTKRKVDLIPVTRRGDDVGSMKTVGMDLSDSKEINRVIKKMSPDVVINSAGLISLKGCEKNPDLAERLNKLAVAELVEVGLRMNLMLLVLLSTDAVFSGNKASEAPFKEVDRPIPANVYGRTKYGGEQCLFESTLPHQIVRTSAVVGRPYSPNRVTFLKAVIDSLKLNREFPAMIDAFNSPTLVDDVVGGGFIFNRKICQ